MKVIEDQILFEPVDDEEWHDQLQSAKDEGREWCYGDMHDINKFLNWTSVESYSMWRNTSDNCLLLVEECN